MTRCVNEIGYRAKVLDTKRFDRTDNSLKNSIRGDRDEDKPIDFQLTTSMNTSNVNTNRVNTHRETREFQPETTNSYAEMSK